MTLIANLKPRWTNGEVDGLDAGPHRAGRYAAERLCVALRHGEARLSTSGMEKGAEVLVVIAMASAS